MQKRKKYTWLKWFAIVLVSLGIVFFLISTYLIKHWEPILTSALKSSVETSTDSLYKLDFSKIKFNLALGNFRIQNVWLRPDTNVYKRLASKGKAPAYLYEIKVDNISLLRSHAWKVYTEKKVDINRIHIDNPEVTIISKYRRQETDTTTDISNITPYDLIKGSLKSVDVNEINFYNVRLKFIQESAGKNVSKEFKFTTIQAKKLYIDSLAQYNKERPLYTDDIRLVMNDLVYPMKDSLYYLKFKSATFSTKNEKLEVQDFKFEPRYNEIEFSKKFEYRKDRFDISIGSMTFNKIDIKRIFYYQRLSVDLLEVDKMSLDVFDNMQIPKSEEKLDRKSVV